LQVAGSNATFSLSSNPSGSQYIDGRRDTLILDVPKLEDLRSYGYLLDLSRLENIALAGTFLIENQQPILAYVQQKCPLLKKLLIVSNPAYDPVGGSAFNIRPEPVRMHLLSINYDLYNMELLDQSNTHRPAWITNSFLSGCFGKEINIRGIIN